MKPIGLIIEGLNSFRQRTEIDFARLMEPGIFGIFGPTGSGKSSVIDALTLALYGEVSRGSRNFINVGAERAQVVLTFTAGEKAGKHYKVSRSYKRDGASGNARADKARLEAISATGESEVLADKTREVDEMCSHILGLSKEDFTRTVVLPQGKFAEFLQMSGRDRTDMLERIFRLEKFGTDLDMRVKRYRGSVEGRLAVLSGQCGIYENEGISPEGLDEMQLGYEAETKKLDETETQLAACEAFIEKWRAVRDALAEKRDCIATKEKLEAKGPEMAAKEEEYKRSGIAGELHVLLDESNTAEERLEAAKCEKREKETETNRLEEETKKAGQAAQEAEENDLKLTPQLTQELERLDHAAALVVQLEAEEGRLAKAKSDQENLEAKRKQYARQIREATKQIECARQQQLTLSERKKSLFHSQQEKQVVQRGADSERDRDRNNKELDRKRKALSEQEEQKRVLDLRTRQLAKERTDTEERYRDTDERLRDIEHALSALPDLVEKQMLLEHAHGAQQQKRQAEEAIRSADHQLQQAEDEAAVLAAREEGLLAKQTRAQDTREKLRRQLLAHSLFEGLTEGEPCPVCGSVQHVKHAADFADAEELRMADKEAEDGIREVEAQLQKLRRRVIQTESARQTAGAAKRAAKGQAAGLDPALLTRDTEALAADIDQVREEQQTLTKTLSGLKEEREALGESRTKIRSAFDIADTKRKNFDTRIREYTNEITHIREKLDAQEAIREACLEELISGGFLAGPALADTVTSEEDNVPANTVAAGDADTSANTVTPGETAIPGKPITSARTDPSFFSTYRETIGTDTEAYEAAEADATRLIAETEQLRAELQHIREADEALAREAVRGTEVRAALAKNIERIRAEFTDEQPQSLAKIKSRSGEIRAQQEKLQREHEKTKRIAAELEKTYAASAKELLETSERTARYFGSFTEKQRRLDKAMLAHAVTDPAWILASYKEAAERAALAADITSYKEACTHIGRRIGELDTRIAGRTLTEDEWEAKTKERDALMKQHKEQSAACTVAEANLKKYKDQLAALQELLKEKEQEEPRHALIAELEKLLRGKAFVRFASQYYLTYVVKDANVRLYEMTNGAYALTLGNSGDFLMRDNKNGGKIRPASTLSGGETFIVSLALALALSKQVQLKGATPIDLFFLDEGFGTLDERFIDVVMDSLYRLKSRGLHVGLITHVEAIKERIGARIMVSPADSGGKGSAAVLEFE